MKIIKQQDVDIEFVVRALEGGQVIVYPTETCYGLGCDVTNELAVQKIFQIKKRQLDKPLLVVASEMAMMLDYLDYSPQLVEISEKYWPGPLTAVVPLRPEVDLPAGVVGPGRTIAFRITDHPLASELSAKLGKPIVSTSANIASMDSPYDVDSVLEMFEGQGYQPDIIIDAGTLPHRSPSTVVKVSDGKLEVLRQGEIVV